MEMDELPTPDNAIFGEIQVLLAEKRTALAALRTGIAVFALPLSVLSALIATSRYYSIDKVMPLLLPLMLLNLGLVVSVPGGFRSIRRIHHFEHRIREVGEKYRSLAQLLSSATMPQQSADPHRKHFNESAGTRLPLLRESGANAVPLQSVLKSGSLRSGSQSGSIRRSPAVTPFGTSSRRGKAAPPNRYRQMALNDRQ